MAKANLAQYQSRIVHAIDVPSVVKVVRAADAVKGLVGLIKVGLQSQTAVSPELLIRICEELGIPYFWDGKYIDIKETIRLLMEVLKQFGSSNMRMVNMYLPDASAATIQAFADGVHALNPSDPPLALGVTLLTSMSDAECLQDYDRYYNAIELVLKRVEKGLKNGLDGFVASPNEARAIRARFGFDPTLVLPAIRPVYCWSDEDRAKDDQARPATPGDAIAAGGDFCVVGRPMSQHPEGRAKAAELINGEINEALAERAA